VTVKATAKGRTFEALTWGGVVDQVISSFSLEATPETRAAAVDGLRRGYVGYIEAVPIKEVSA
jgi:hypothetical protein